MTDDPMTYLDPYTLEPWDPQAAAARGAALLDRMPEWAGWRGQINVGQLDMSDGFYRGKGECLGCIGAQLDYHRQLQTMPPADRERFDPERHWGLLEGEYGEFLWKLAGLDAGEWRSAKDFSVHYGFNVPDAHYGPELQMFEDLTGAWRRLLEAGS